MPTTAELQVVIKAQDQASKVLRDLGGTLGQVDKQAGAMSKAFAGAGNVLKGAAFAGGAAGLLAVAEGATRVVGALTSGVGMANTLEQVTARFNAFTKDGAETARILDRVRDEADRTPFAFQEMASAAAMLLPASRQASQGLEGLIKEAEILAALNPSEGLEGAAFALREALSGDFVSVMERFNIPRELINRLKEEGVPNAQIVGRALEEMGADFSLVGNLAQTTEGRFSTLQDALGRLQVVAGEPILAALSEAVDELSRFLADNQQELQELAKLLGGAVAQAVRGAIQLFRDWAPRIGDAVRRIGDLRDGVEDALRTIGAFVDRALRPVIATLGSLIGRVEEAAGGWEGAWATIREAVDRAWEFLSPLFREVGDALGRFSGEILPELAETWEAVSVRAQEAWRGLVDFLRPALEAFARFWEAHHDTLLLVLTAAWDTIKDVLGVALSALETVISVALNVIQGDWEGAWQEIREFLSETWDAVERVTDRALDLLGRLVRAGMDAVWGAITDAWNAALQATLDAWAAISGHVGAAVHGLWETVAGAFSGITQSVVGSVNDVRTYLASAWDTIQGNAASAWQGVAAAIVGAVNSVLGPIQATISAVNSLISSVGGALSGLQGAANAAASAIRSIPSLPSAPSGGGGGGAGASTNLQTFREGGKPGETRSEAINFLVNTGTSRAEAERITARPQVFAGGGVVEGLPGSAQWALLHAGETVFTPAQLAALADYGGGSVIDYGALAAAIVHALPSAELVLDGVVVGRTVTPYVTSEQDRFASIRVR